jgi:hypothetical protein
MALQFDLMRIAVSVRWRTHYHGPDINELAAAQCALPDRQAIPKYVE